MKDNIILLLSFTWSLVFTILKVTAFPNISWWLPCAPLICLAITVIIALTLVFSSWMISKPKKDSDR